MRQGLQRIFIYAGAIVGILATLTEASFGDCPEVTYMPPPMPSGCSFPKPVLPYWLFPYALGMLLLLPAILLTASSLYHLRGKSKGPLVRIVVDSVIIFAAVALTLVLSTNSIPPRLLVYSVIALLAVAASLSSLDYKKILASASTTPVRLYFPLLLCAISISIMVFIVRFVDNVNLFGTRTCL